MGIPFLTRLLYPYSESVTLGDCPGIDCGGKSVKSVVIDGPSLVYHISTRLLSQSDPNLHYPDLQPTCNEVSRGFVTYLLQLKALGVKIEKICFDGALPAQKRDIRLARLEKSRRRLEDLRSKPICMSRDSYQARTIEPETVLRRRNLPAKYSHVPENSFIVPVVFEDLKRRWCRKNIANMIENIQGIDNLAIKDIDWASITVMVPGEADVYCAYLARVTGSSILTNDSDLLLHDLGTIGSVVFLSSVEMEAYDVSHPERSRIRALKLCPALVAHRLGIANLRPLAYELKKSPHIGMDQLIQRLKTNKGSLEDLPAYLQFAEEYQITLGLGEELANQSYPQCFDPRISELYSQYRVWSEQRLTKSLHMYLVILNEDHTRQCAWTKGQLYRNIAYSALNISHPVNTRHAFVNEYVRRGGRIINNQISLGDKEWILTEIRSLLGLLNLIYDIFGTQMASPVYWTMFALYVIYDGQANTTPSTAHLTKFLDVGYMSETPDWADIHLLAQIQSVLYSLRILQQLLGFSGLTEGPVIQTRAVLDNLPPLYMLVRAPCEIREEFNTGCSVNEHVHRLMQLLGQSHHVVDFPRCKTKTQLYPNESEKQASNSLHSFPVTPSVKKPCNIFELLSQE
ncbi:hypothetical protein BO71DRAFT_382875 [Aspergillus ellipticus CBS 707.79]|uniref:Asteroid domain-containing protein n=1 Tax=Aspergillus ellipticus CBS 707.79 TaxID=1448320 RepID=A0A319D678_9EURO|nr:hypothetical protein BO71DRAFT_382875 [Aspergillus ellipticus CBS 707.79]